jgi:hypothetical protein
LIGMRMSSMSALQSHFVAKAGYHLPLVSTKRKSAKQRLALPISSP